jgi:hypothetical protein
MKLNLFYLSGFLLLTGLFIGCKDQGVDVDDRIIPDENVSFSQHIQPVFEFHCVPCHNEQTREGGLSLTSWAAATSDLSIIFPGEPDNSRLVWAIEGRSGVFFMPPIGSPYRPLNQNQINGVKTWIREGALNN